MTQKQDEQLDYVMRVVTKRLAKPKQPIIITGFDWSWLGKWWQTVWAKMRNINGRQ